MTNRHADLIAEAHTLTSPRNYLRETTPFRDLIRRLTSALKAEAAKAERLRAALEPFARLAELQDYRSDNESYACHDTRMRDLRRARAALNPGPAGEAGIPGQPVSAPPGGAGAGVSSSTLLDEIAAERRRQIEAEGYTPEHDDGHDGGELAMAASAWAHPQQIVMAWGDALDKRPKPRRRQLIIAAALIVAEIERLERIQ